MNLTSGCKTAGMKGDHEMKPNCSNEEKAVVVSGEHGNHSKLTGKVAIALQAGVKLLQCN